MEFKMKNLIVLIIAGVILITFSEFSFAQKQGDITVGAGVTYGFEVEEMGIQLNGNYAINEKMRIGADFIYWLTESSDYYSVTMWEFNANFHYIFYNEKGLILYGMGTLGLHTASVKVDHPLVGSSTSSDSEIGLGLGGGLEYNLGSVKLFAEPRLFISGYDQFTFSAGVRLPI